ncbi:MAG: RnfABCDGE type electron transport complex subunit D [Bacteroidota bacterium]
MLRKIKNIFFKDARHFQILYLGLFLMLGVFFLGWEMELWNYLAVFSGALITQMLCIIFITKKWHSIKSALITALGLCLLLKANSPWVLCMAASLAIAAKFFIQFKNKHVFNPANLGIIAAIVLTGQAWISPGQWGSAAVLFFLIGVLGFIVLLKVGRLDISITFLVCFFIVEYIRTVLYFGWEMDVLLHKFTNGSFLLFTFFMITDPVTTPNHPKARIIWAAVLALLSFVLTSWFYIHTAPIWALFFLSPITIYLDRTWKAERFHWFKQKNIQSIKPLNNETY